MILTRPELLGILKKSVLLFNFILIKQEKYIKTEIYYIRLIIA